MRYAHTAADVQPGELAYICGGWWLYLRTPDRNGWIAVAARDSVTHRHRTDATYAVLDTDYDLSSIDIGAYEAAQRTRLVAAIRMARLRIELGTVALTDTDRNEIARMASITFPPPMSETETAFAGAGAGIGVGVDSDADDNDAFAAAFDESQRSEVLAEQVEQHTQVVLPGEET